MNNSNRISSEDIRRVAEMSDKQLKEKLSQLSSSSGDSALGKMLSNLNIDMLKKQLRTKNPDDLANLMNKLGSLDSSFINKLKALLK